MLVPIKSLYPFFGLTLSPDKVCKAFLFVEAYDKVGDDEYY